MIYSRRLVLGKYEDFKHDRKFMNISLKNVHETDIKSFYEFLMFNIDNNHEEDILNIIVMEELKCFPKLYEYEARGLAGRWLVFGAILDLKEESREKIIEKLGEWD